MYLAHYVGNLNVLASYLIEFGNTQTRGNQNWAMFIFVFLKVVEYGAYDSRINTLSCYCLE